MKILSDFDGVLTDQTEEAAMVRRLIIEGLQDLCAMPRGEAEALVARGEAAMAGEPNRNGWKFNDRITAFADEDLFIRANGLGAWLDARADGGDVELIDLRRRLRANDVQDFRALAQRSYVEMTEHTRKGGMEPLDPKAMAVLQELLDEGHEVVVVSNSGTSRILHLLETSGVPAYAHGEEAPEGMNAIRVRGGARKYELGPMKRGFEVGQYFVDTARPVYEEILREERPDAVIGDVFSLDLALPLFLARTDGERFGGIRLLLRKRQYTPGWVDEFFENDGIPGAYARLGVLNHFTELPQHLQA